VIKNRLLCGSSLSGTRAPFSRQAARGIEIRQSALLVSVAVIARQTDTCTLDARDQSVLAAENLGGFKMGRGVPVGPPLSQKAGKGTAPSEGLLCAQSNIERVRTDKQLGTHLKEPAKEKV